jgi:hypothetical protein
MIWEQGVKNVADCRKVLNVFDRKSYGKSMDLCW